MAPMLVFQYAIFLCSMDFGESFLIFQQLYKPMQFQSNFVMKRGKSTSLKLNTDLVSVGRNKQPMIFFRTPQADSFGVSVKTQTSKINQAITQPRTKERERDMGYANIQYEKQKANRKPYVFLSLNLKRRRRFVKYIQTTSLDQSKKTGMFSGANVCPQACHCQYRPDNTIDVIDCSNIGCREIPRLPSSTRKVYLQNNMIQEVPCGSFTELKSLTTLDLSINLIHLLSRCSFTNLTSLKYLWLSHNNMNAFPIGVFDFLQSLIYLDVSYNMINTLNPDLFINTTKLINLNLGNNNLTKIKNHTFQGLSSLGFLSLRYNSLRYLPWTFESKAFQGLASLESLRLEGNQPDFSDNFTYPDQELALVTTLRRLWLDRYPRQLGPGFSQLLNLTHLTFEGACKLRSEIPANFFNNIATKNPFFLSMVSCEISMIPPDSFKALQNIYSLDLSYNKQLLLDGFETASRGLQNSTLTILNLTDIVHPSYIGVKIKATTFRYLKNTKLKILIVEKCKVVGISPQAIIDLPQTTEYISFRKNMLLNGYFLLSTLHLLNLKILDVSNQRGSTRTKNAPYAQPFLKSVNNYHTSNTNAPNENSLYRFGPFPDRKGTSQQIDESYSPFAVPFKMQMKSLKEQGFCDSSRSSPLQVPFPSHLEQFNASASMVSYDIPKIHFTNNVVWKTFDLSGNNIKCFGGPISGIPSLQYFDLSRNDCFKVSPFFFSYGRSLKTLLLYENKLGRSLSQDIRGMTFSSLIKLETLDLSNNVIENLSEMLFKSNEHLKVLNLSNNVMSSFCPSLAYNKKLEVLDLSSNLLVGLSQTTCRQLLSIKSSSPNFTVHIGGNYGFLCDCNHLYFLRFLLDHREIFEGVKTTRCHLTNGSILDFNQLSEIIPQLGDECIAQPVFVVVLSVFFLLVSSVGACGLYNFKRWQWKYLYYLSKRRLHIGSTLLIYRPVAHVFVTYDQENRRLRNMMKNVFRPRLHEIGVTTVLGEVDFEAGPREASIAGAVTSTRKTLVFFSPGIFQDYYRQLEVNLAIMHELHLRRAVLVPVLLLREELLTWPGPRSDVYQRVTERSANLSRRASRAVRYRNHAVEDFTRFQNLLRRYPPEIATFLRGQLHRCLVYIGDTDDFWQQLKRVILEDDTD